jgi:hypothetical protein
MSEAQDDHAHGQRWRRDADLARSLVAVSELMVETDDIDAVYGMLMTECLRLLDVSAAGLVLSGEQGLTPVTCIGASANALTSLQQSTGVGPSVDAASSGDDVDAGMDEARRRWPPWAAAAEEYALTLVTSLPVCLVEQPVGALELHLKGQEALQGIDRQVAKTFAGLAAVVVHHDAELRRTSSRVEQLEGALRTRIVVEQAKGFLLAREYPTLTDAFEAMRAYARRHGARISAVGEDVLSGKLDVRRLRDP